MNDAAAKTNEAHESKQKDENKKIEEKKIENEIVAKNIVEIGSYIKRDEKETFMNMNNNEIKPNDTDDPTTLAKELRNENEIEMDETDDVKILATEKYINKGDKHNSITGMFLKAKLFYN